jgi:DNA polymerase III delta prime subunit
MNGFFQTYATKIEEPFTAKYKPYFIDEFSIDIYLKNALRAFIKMDDLNILISGPACCGKTTLLYAILRDYYQLKRTDPIPENNILFINNLKEQGINYYRNEMKTFCQSRCSIYGKKKLIIVDDLDMISDQCQQVFRNYIDKYKNNIQFVSVCTTVQKVIESIQSRLHIMHMEMPCHETVRSIMNEIIDKEHLPLHEDAKEYILTFSNYNVREVINYLEKLFILKKNENEITLVHCKQCVSCISFHLFETYIQCIREQNTIKAIEILYEIYDYGYSVIDIFDFFFHFVKLTTLLEEKERYLILPFLCKYITYFHSIHEDIIEVALFTRDLQNILHQ